MARTDQLWIKHDPRSCQRFLKPLPPPRARRIAWIARDKADPAMAKRDQMLCHFGGSGTIVDKGRSDFGVGLGGRDHRERNMAALNLGANRG